MGYKRLKIINPSLEVEVFRDWRNKYKKGYRERQNKIAFKKGKHYTKEEIRMIINKECPDKKLAEMFGRTTFSIQATRDRQRRREKNEKV